jgi:hypothetical protein
VNENVSLSRYTTLGTGGPADRFALPEKLDELVPGHLNHLLGRRERAEDFLTHRFRPHALDEVPRHLELDVSLQERQTDLAQGLVHVLLAEPGLTSELSKNALKFFGNLLEHGRKAWP